MTEFPSLDIRDLRFAYPEVRGDGWTVNVRSFSLGSGEQALLRGGSGQGKSTLLQLIAGLMDPQEGRIRIAGTDLHSLHGAARDRFRGTHIGIIFQTFNLLHGFTAAENVMAAMMFSSTPRREHRSRAVALLNHLGINEPDRDPQRMSVGQQQRVAVARAVACDPVLVLADEPTASLDPENAQTAVRLIQDICREQDTSLLCVSHDPSMTSAFERVTELASLGEEPAHAPSSAH